ncbi:hypothetical protein BS47DRAFT_1481710 [Hydnum rufescens UP504]|uniref:Ribosomal protein S2 n=1 Tax=Hydnum rufescens UP504 TaxID=1448309 RepID=A0A9P6B8N1_9AGAM|nr:hypothetical protein BS47DRAFT_1481710 [Hydnum rufescens UP504]
MGYRALPIPIARPFSTYRPLLVRIRPAEPVEPEWPASPGIEKKQREILEYRRHQRDLISFFSRLGSTQTRENSWRPHHSLHRPRSPKELTLSALIAAGAHMGHARSSTRPPFLPYIYGYRSGIAIIDLDQTLPHLRRAANVTRAIAAADGTVLFVGTTEALGPAVRKAAERMGENGFHLDSRWIPGLLTNPFEVFGEETSRTTNVKPDLIVFLNPLQNLKALRECAIARVPTIAITDSNTDPRIVLYPIPANDESVRTAELIVGALSIAGREGLQVRDERRSAQAKMNQQAEQGREQEMAEREGQNIGQ